MPRARVLAIVTIAAAISAAPAHATTLNVTTTVDETNAGDHACSLREAIAAVNSPGSANGDCTPAAFGANTIVLGASTYTLGNAFPGQHDELLLGATANVTIAGAGEGKTVLEATGLGNRVFEIASGATVTISDLTINGGRAPDGAAGAAGVQTNAGAGQPGGNGGAILNNGNLSIGDAAVTNSRAGNGGAGGATPGSISNPAVNGGAGGAGGSGGAIFSTGTLTLTGVTIAGNQAGSGGAGGSGGQNNTTNPGGAGGNGGAAGGGGGVANNGGSLTIAATTVRGNTAGNGGAGGTGGGSQPEGGGTGGVGGIGGAGGSGGGMLSANAPLSVTNSTIASNTTGNGGGGGAGGVGLNPGSTGGAGGSAGSGGSGGGIAVNNAVGSTVLNATIVGNNVGQVGPGGAGGTGATNGPAGSDGAGGSAGGVTGLAGSSLAVQNSLLALNSAGNCGGSVSDGGRNLSSGGTGCPASFASGDPKLGALQDNGGPSQTISPGAGSAAIDKIPPAGAGCPATDQRGVKRPAGSACDIGAYEFASPTVGRVTVTNVGKTNATINVPVTPNAGTAQVEVDYGRTTAYGSKAVKTVGGVVEVPTAVQVSHLRAKTTYHFRVVVTALDGTTATKDASFTTSPAPVLSKLKIKPSAFRAGGRGATIAYADSLASSVTFVVLRRAPGSRRFVRVGSFTHRDKVGPNSVRFNGRLRSGKLARGSYRLELTARANGRSSRILATTFRITD